MCIFILFLIQILINDSSVYMRSFVADGNFKADHLKQKTDDTDVWLTNGALAYQSGKAAPWCK